MLNKAYLFGSIPLAIMGLAALCLLITKLIRTISAAELARVTLTETATVEFPDAGNIQMHLEGPRLTRTFARLQYTLTDTLSGGSVPISRSLMSMQSSGIDTARVLHGTLHITHPGRYTLYITGLGGQADRARCHIVFTRPYTFVAVLCILGIVFSALAFLGGTLFSLLILLGKAH